MIRLMLPRPPWVVVPVLLAASVAWAQQPLAEAEPGAQEEPRINFVEGPTTGQLGELAAVEVPEGFVFAGAEDTQLIMKLGGNAVSGGELGYLSPNREENRWTALFEFEDSGYVKDDDKDEIDADAILKSFTEGTEQSNARRRELGIPELHVTGWAEAPRYDEENNNLVWALKAVSDGKDVVNYHTKLLGRTGVMSVVLITDPALLATVMPEYKKMLASFRYVDGQRYADWRQGDRVAEYGLMGLMGVGVAALAAKTGLLSKLWKFIAIGVVAVGAFFKKLFFGEKIGKS